MADAKGIDPAQAARGVEKAEQRRKEMEDEVEKLLKEWRESLAHVRSESERVLSE